MRAADDVDFIAKRLKEIEAEKQALLGQPLEPDQPSNSPMWGIGGESADYSAWANDPFWGMLVRNGIIRVSYE